ncbi:MAG: hypothetical protein A4E60_02358 [Syntrophorhabdus sp. PtaB.Bin047]|jgi:hypothetical protein|nr:MAG: hypothetical protein A4E60_02358 [Syntrophorhabdus sp. PtaB.Bin047]
MILALMKRGFSYREVLSLTEAEALGYVEAYLEMVDPKRKGRTYKVRKART